MAETSCRRSPSDGHGRLGLDQGDGDAPLVGGGPDPLHGLGHDQADQDRLAGRGLLGLDPAEVQQVVDDPADPERLGVDPAGQPLGHLDVGLGDERLGQEARARPSGVFSSWLTLATKSRRISSSRRRSETSSIMAMTPSGRRPSSMSRARTVRVRRGGP